MAFGGGRRRITPAKIVVDRVGYGLVGSDRRGPASFRRTGLAPRRRAVRLHSLGLPGGSDARVLAGGLGWRFDLGGPRLGGEMRCGRVESCRRQAWGALRTKRSLWPIQEVGKAESLP